MLLAETYYTLGDIWAIALSVVGFGLSLQGLWLVCRALWPARVEAAARRCEHNRVGSFFMGLFVTAAMVLLMIGMARRGGAPGKGLAWIVGFFYLIFSGIGVSGLATHIGRRLESPVDAGRPWRATLRGGLALELAYMVPVLGWFGILGFSLLIGVGAATLGAFSRRRAELPSLSMETPRRLWAGEPMEPINPARQEALR